MSGAPGRLSVQVSPIPFLPRSSLQARPLIQSSQADMAALAVTGGSSSAACYTASSLRKSVSPVSRRHALTRDAVQPCHLDILPAILLPGRPNIFAGHCAVRMASNGLNVSGCHQHLLRTDLLYHPHGQVLRVAPTRLHHHDGRDDVHPVLAHGFRCHLVLGDRETDPVAPKTYVLTGPPAQCTGFLTNALDCTVQRSLWPGRA